MPPNMDDVVDVRMSAEPVIPTEAELKHTSRHMRGLISTDEARSDERMNISNLSEQLFATASSPSLPATHRVAAWNTLCAFIDELARSGAAAGEERSEIRGIWGKALDLYIDTSQQARPKSAKQLLSTLGTTLREIEDPGKSHQQILQRSCELLETDAHPRQSKAVLQLLTHFLSKDLLSVRVLDLGLRNRAAGREISNEDDGIPHLLACLFRWASYEDFGSVVGRCLSVTLDKHAESVRRQRSTLKDSPTEAVSPVWASTLQKILHGDADIEQLRVHIFPVLFKRSPCEFVQFLRAHGLDRLVSDIKAVASERQSPEDRRLLCAALQSGKELGLLCESADPETRLENNVLFVPVGAFGILLRDQDRDARIAGLSILVNSHSATRPFLRRTLALLQNCLSSFLADTDANFRSEVFSLVQRMMDRIRAITAVLARTAELSTDQKTRGLANLNEHRTFVQWLLRCLTWELRPTASYQRHISALKCLSIITRSAVDKDVPVSFWTKSASAETKWPFNIAILHAGLEQLLLDLLVDPFDDVRQTASSILSMYAHSSAADGATQGWPGLQKTTARAEQMMMASGRADQADGVAHMYALQAHTSNNTADRQDSAQPLRHIVVARLIGDLEKMLGRAQTSLAGAAKRYPMHGLLTSIRYAMPQTNAKLSEEDVDRLCRCLQLVWETVRPVLCNDAPEGYEHEDPEDPGEGSSKDVLSYCWRALKESSLLLSTLIADPALPAEKMTQLADLCFSELAELRHRGAFSTVAQTWVICCCREASVNSHAGSETALQKWYRQAFDILKNRTTINTRRSAGIPSLLCGILIADKSAVLLAKAFDDLCSIANEPVDAGLANESSLPQVHALNCIKDILKNTRLGEQSEQYVPASLRLAASSLRSEAWAIRNCGLMLFRGVIDRLLGTSDAYLEDDAGATKRISVQQHPELLDIVLQLLHIPTDSEDGAATRYEGVFPALQMLQRMELPTTRQDEAQIAVLRLTASPSWHVREKAARTFAAIIGNGDVPDALDGTISAASENQNALHGALLCLKHVVAATNKMAKPSSRDISSLLRLRRTSSELKGQMKHPVTRAAWNDTLVEYIRLQKSMLQDAKLTEELEAHEAPNFVKQLCEILASRSGCEPNEAIERTSLARAGACQTVRAPADDAEGGERYGLTLQTLADLDADTCAEYWRALRSELVAAGQGVPPRCVQTLMSPAAEMLSGTFPPGLKCEVQSFLLFAVDSGIDGEEIAAVISRSSSPFAANSNHIFADRWLQLRAVAVDHHIQTQSSSDTAISSFISSCNLAVPSSTSFFSREAAALALSRTHHLWPFLAAHRNNLACTVYLTVYDLLNDDDEDLRLLGTHLVSRIIPHEPLLEPIIASQRLLSHMLAQLSISRTVAPEAFARAFGDIDTPVVDQLHALLATPDTALFATEKQNLYLDAAREVRAWSQVLCALPPCNVPKKLVKALTFWVDEGLYTLTTRVGKGGNGALGWLSADEVFVLGLKVFYAVEVLMSFVTKGGKLPMEPSEVVRRLVLFADALEGIEEDGGGLLWVWEVKRVLGDVVQGRLRLAWALAGEVKGGAVGDDGQDTRAS